MSVIRHDFTITPIPDYKKPLAYTVAPKPEMVLAKFRGRLAKCGHCGHGLGEFVKVDGHIRCKQSDCRVMNIVKL